MEDGRVDDYVEVDVFAGGRAIPLGVIAAMPPVTISTLASWMAGYHLLLGRILLHPMR